MAMHSLSPQNEEHLDPLLHKNQPITARELCTEKLLRCVNSLQIKDSTQTYSQRHFDRLNKGGSDVNKRQCFKVDISMSADHPELPL